MKLFYSQNSPYARVARIAVLESSLADTVEHVRVINRAPDNPLREISPTCRVPTLVNGRLVLGETRLICAYIDDLQRCAQFFPAGPPNWQLISTESIVLAFLDSIVVQVSENRRPANPYSDKRVEFEREKTQNCLKLFNKIVKTNPHQFLSWDFTSISLAAALSLMDFHSFIPEWRSEQTGLANWFDENSSRSSMVKTAPV